MESSSNVDSLHQLFRKLAANCSSTKSDEDQSLEYILLIQYCLHKQLRLAAASAASASSDPRQKSTRRHPSSSSSSGVVSQTVYLRAGLRTPAENALRDLQGAALWIPHITQLLCHEFESVILLRSLPTRSSCSSSWIASIPNLHVVDAARDPFGWGLDAKEEGDTDEEEDSGMTNMSNLDHLLTCIQQTTSTLLLNNNKLHSNDSNVHNRPSSSLRQVPLVIQSLTPIYQRHGLRRTVQFLKSLSSSCCYPLIVPVLTESLQHDHHHRTLEDLAHALLYLNAGEATLLRQGVREKANLVRESLAFEITSSSSSILSKKESSSLSSFTTRGEERRQILRLLPSSVKEVASTSSSSSKTSTTGLRSSGEPARDASSENSNTTATATLTRAVEGKGKVQLALADDDAPRNPTAIQLQQQQDPSSSVAAAETQRPRIYIQDDDPEFDDYDEEDPDDDLDI